MGEQEERVKHAAQQKYDQTRQQTHKAIETGGYLVEKSLESGQEVFNSVLKHPVRHASQMSQRATQRANKELRGLTEYVSAKTQQVTSTSRAIISYAASQVNLKGHQVLETVERFYNYVFSLGVLRPLGLIYPIPVHRPGRAIKPVIVITGCGHGIGRQMALELANAGYVVFAGVHEESQAQNLSQEFGHRRGKLGELVPIKLDINHHDDREKIFKSVQDYIEREQKEGRNTAFAALINNAAIVESLPWEAADENALQHFFENNATSHIMLTHRFFPLIRGDHGRVINISSISDFVKMRTFGPYCVSKAALSTFSDTLRLEMRDFDVGVVNIKPGFIESRATDRADTRVESLMHQLLSGQKPFRNNLPHNIRKQYALQLKDYSRFLMMLQGARIPAHTVSVSVKHALTSNYPKETYYVGLDARMAAMMNTLFGFKAWLVLDWMLSGFR